MDWLDRRVYWTLFWAVMSAAMIGTLAWALSDVHRTTAKIVLVAIGIVAVAVLRAISFHFSRKTEDREDEKWNDADAGRAAGAVAPLAVVMEEAKRYRQTLKKQNRSKEFGEILTISGVFLAAAIAYLQWETLEKTDETLRLQDRAWLGAGPLDKKIPNLTQKFDRPTPIYLSYKNFGKSPASKVNIKIYFDALSSLDFHAPKKLTSARIKAMEGAACEKLPLNTEGRTIFPGVENQRIGFTVPVGLIEKINKSGDYLLVAGCFVYESIGARRQTRYCAILAPHDRTREDWDTTLCDQHNDAN